MKELIEYINNKLKNATKELKKAEKRKIKFQEDYYLGICNCCNDILQEIEWEKENDII